MYTCISLVFMPSKEQGNIPIKDSDCTEACSAARTQEHLNFSSQVLPLLPTTRLSACFAFRKPDRDRMTETWERKGRVLYVHWRGKE